MLHWLYAECHTLFIVVLSVIMLNFVTLNVIMLNVVMLSVVAPSKSHPYFPITSRLFLLLSQSCKSF
jgi:hypothetical protein